MHMNAMYLLGLIKQSMNFEFANSNHIAYFYAEASVTILCMHRMGIFPNYCTDSKTLTSHSQRKQHIQRSLK